MDTTAAVWQPLRKPSRKQLLAIRGRNLAAARLEQLKQKKAAMEGLEQLQHADGSDAAAAAEAADDGDMDLDADDEIEDEDDEEDGEEQQQQLFGPRPRRVIHAPKRYSPVKQATGRPRGRWAQKHLQLPQNTHKKHTAVGRAAKKPTTATKPRTLKPAAAAAAAAAAAVQPPSDMELATANLGLQLSGQYDQLLQQVQGILSSLHTGKLYTQPEELLAELTGLAAHRQQLQQLQGSMQTLMDTIQQMLPCELQQQAREALAAYSAGAGGHEQHADNSPGASSAHLHQQQEPQPQQEDS